MVVVVEQFDVIDLIGVICCEQVGSCIEVGEFVVGVVNFFVECFEYQWVVLVGYGVGKLFVCIEMFCGFVQVCLGME